MKTTFHRFESLVLALALALTLVIPASATSPEESEDAITGGIVTSGLHNFQRVKSYKEGRYSDVPATHTFSENAKAAYEFDIMQGYGTTFGVGNNITRLASIIIACRLHCIYEVGGNYVELYYEGTTRDIYLSYARENGIFCDFDDVSECATRAEFAAILSSAFPDEALEAINTVADNAIPDVTVSTKYADDIYRLYRAGILNGSDAKGTFYPDSNITRGAACAIATRMCDESLRKSITLTNDSENIGGGSIGAETVSEEHLRAAAKAEELVKFYVCVSPREVETFLIDDYGFSKDAAAYGVKAAQLDDYWKTFAVAMAEEFFALAPVEPSKADVETYLTDSHAFNKTVAQYAVSTAKLNRDSEISVDWMSLAEVEEHGYSAKITSETINLRYSAGKEYVLTGLPAEIYNGDHFFMDLDGVNIWVMFYHSSNKTSQLSKDNFYLSARGLIDAGLLK